MPPPLRHYAAFGHCLAAERDLPELEPLEGVPPRWRVTEGMPHDAPPPRAAQPALGEEPLYEGVSAWLRARAGGWRVDVDDTATFDLDASAAGIVVRPYAQATDDFIRAHLLGRVLATAFHLTGAFVAHGSAVALAAGGVGFLAPKGAGKSTLALALVAQGAHLLTDDTLPIELDGAVPMARPGIHAARLHRDTLERTGAVPISGERADGKVVAAAPPRRQRVPVPLAALYLLAPASAIAAGHAARRDAVPPPVAAAALVAHAKVNAMLGPGEAPTLLRRAAQLARAVPVYRLAVLRDAARLDEAAGAIAAWHGGAPA